MKSFLFCATMVLLGAVSAAAQSPVDSTDRTSLEVTPEREIMEEPAIEPMTPSEFEMRDQPQTTTLPVDSTSLSPEDGDPQTDDYLNPQPAMQPEPGDTTRTQRPNGYPKR